MSERFETQVLIVGGGPGGYVAAIRAGQLGLQVSLVEGERLGGVCLTRGCIPSKAVIHAAAQFEAAHRAEGENPLGISTTGKASIDFSKTVRWKDGIVDRLSSGVAALLKKNRVKRIEGWPTFTDAKTCAVAQAGGKPLTIHAQHVVLATGSEAVNLPGLPFGGDILSSTEALNLTRIPERLAVVGAGYIGLELGTAFRKLGAQVTVIEFQDRILPQYDEALSAPIAKALARAGVEVRLGCKAIGFKSGALQIEDSSGARHTIPADKVLVTVGRRPRLTGYGLEAMGVDIERGAVKIDDHCRTAMKDVWAIGDVTGEPMLAHRASAQGEVVAEQIAGRRAAFAPMAIPAVCFTEPEVVTVGLQPAQAATGGREVMTAMFPLAANGRALSMEAGEDDGFIRVVAAAADHRLLGFAAVGRHVSELSGEMTALLEMGGRLEDVSGIIHAHPPLSESLQEAALRSMGRAIHI